MKTKCDSPVIIYQGGTGLPDIEVRFDGETAWLSRVQLAALFGRDVKTIGKHIKNALAEELKDFSTVAKFATVQFEGTRQVERLIEHYNLDMILSVGYRVKSVEGVRFRIWANKILKEYLIQGYAVNRGRLAQLNTALEIISRSDIPEVAGVAGILKEYTDGLDRLDDYDHQRVAKAKGSKGRWRLTYEAAREFIDAMRFGHESALFGKEKDESFKATLGTLYQTFGGQELYPSVQEKAANLLYLTVKNHSFLDGNKRIAAALFVWFLAKNKALRDKKTGRPRIDNNTLASATLMLALSKPQEKGLMCQLVMQFLTPNKKNRNDGCDAAH